VPQQVPPLEPQAPPQQVVRVPEMVVEPPRVPQQVPPLEPQAPPQQVVRVPEMVVEPPRVPQQVPPLEPQAPPQQVVRAPEMVVEPPRAPQRVPILVTPHPNEVHRPPEPSGLAPRQPGASLVIQVSAPHQPSEGQSRPHVVSIPGTEAPLVTGGRPHDGSGHVIQPMPQGPHVVPANLHPSYWLEEVIEPGIRNHRVELYRSNDAREVAYQDVIPMDKTGFHLTVIGTRPPRYLIEP
jgi:hypothetical protein